MGSQPACINLESLAVNLKEIWAFAKTSKLV